MCLYILAVLNQCSVMEWWIWYFSEDLYLFPVGLSFWGVVDVVGFFGGGVKTHCYCPAQKREAVRRIIGALGSLVYI